VSEISTSRMREGPGHLPRKKNAVKIGNIENACRGETTANSGSTLLNCYFCIHASASFLGVLNATNASQPKIDLSNRKVAVDLKLFLYLMNGLF
jgi:hypothetical protein